MNIENHETTLRVYPAPQGSVLREDYILRVRPAGAKEWQTVDTYQVKVDMHDVRMASMAYFDFEGKVEVEITFPRFYTVYRADIRPVSLGIQPAIEPCRVTFTLEHPANMSVEINRDRFHNLHLFAGAIEKAPDKNGKNVLIARGELSDSTSRALERMPEGRILYVEAGVHYIGECVWRLPSHTNIYLEGGAILIGGLIFENGEDLHISGRGMVYLADFARFSGTNGIRLSHCKHVTIEGIIFVNPPHYTVYLGDCEHVTIRNIKSFSREGWSDGIDMMSCRDVTVEGGFLRTSDDCVAIYGSRWDNRGDSRNITVRKITLWADVAHPTMIGVHGDYAHDGDTIENVCFENIDILEHHEFQPGYLGALAINVGDKNLVRNVTYRNIRIEPFEHGKVFDLQVRWNPDYNPAPGRGIEAVLLEDIQVQTSDGEETSVIDGYSNEFPVRNVTIRRMTRNGKPVHCLEEANIHVGAYASDIHME